MRDIWADPVVGVGMPLLKALSTYLHGPPPHLVL